MPRGSQLMDAGASVQTQEVWPQIHSSDHCPKPALLESEPLWLRGSTEDLCQLLIWKSNSLNYTAQSFIYSVNQNFSNNIPWDIYVRDHENAYWFEK